MATPYVKQTWIDGDTTKPLSAARLGVIETGIFDAHYRPSVAVYNNASLSIPNSTPTTLTFNTELFDTDNMHSTVSNTGRLTSPVAGKYLISGTCGFAANATGFRQLLMRINGTTFISHVASSGTTTNLAEILQVTRLYQLAAGDFVELIAQQSSGGALGTGPDQQDPEFSMFLASY